MSRKNSSENFIHKIPRQNGATKRRNIKTSAAPLPQLARILYRETHALGNTFLENYILIMIFSIVIWGFPLMVVPQMDGL